MRDSTRYLGALYRFRWPIAALVLLSCVGLMGAGMSRVEEFSRSVDALKDDPPETSEPRIFDARLEIWFDSADPALETHFEVEEEFIAQDTVLVVFEDREDPWGVFGERSLETIARLTEAIRKVPYVRHVRSLTSTPWIRWGEVAPGEQGLLITDLFAEDAASYSPEQRLERMIAILGAERAAALVGEEVVRDHLGPDADFADHIGEPRLIDGVVSRDGRTTALQVQLIRTKLPPEKLASVFGDDPHERALGASIHSTEAQWSALDEIEAILATEKGYDFHITGPPPFMRNFMEVGMADMKWVGVMFVFLAVVLFSIYRRLASTGIALLVVLAAILGMNGAIFLMGDQLNNLTAIVPHIVVAVGIPGAVHLITTYHLLRPQFDDKRELIIETVRHMAWPVFLTSVTTAAGFFTLASSTLEPMVKFGYTGGIGTVLAYIATMTVTPAFLSLIPLRKKDAKDAKLNRILSGKDVTEPAWTDVFVRFAVKRRVELVAGGLVLLVLAGLGASRVDLNADSREWFPDDNVVIRDLNWIEDRLGGMADLDIVFSAPPSGEDSAEAMARQARLEELELQRLLHERCEAGAAAAPADQPADEAAAAAATPSDTPAPPPEAPAEDAACPPALSAEAAAELDKLRAEEARAQRRRIAVSHEFLSTLERFDARLREEMADPESPLSVITSMESGLDVLRKIHQVQNQGRAAYYRVPTAADVPEEARHPSLEYDMVTDEAFLIPAQDASSLAAQYYVQYESGAKPVENLSALISPDRHKFRIAARVAQAPSSEHVAAFDRLRELAATEFPELTGTEAEVASGEALASMDLTGKALMAANMFETTGANLLRSAFLAIGVITLVIMLAFRSVRLGVISLLPNVLPLALPLGAFGLLGLYLDSPSIVVAAVAIGVCVDDTVHLLIKFQGARNQGHDTLECLLRAFRYSGIAITISTVVLVFGFATMIFSAYRPNILIGVLATTMIAFAWVCELLLTPALLSFMPSKKKN